MYKEFLTIFKDSQSGTVDIAGKIFSIQTVEGLKLYSNVDDDSIRAQFLVIIDPLTQLITAIKTNPSNGFGW